MAFPTSNAQQETNRKILEQLSSQLQKSVSVVGLGNTGPLNTASLSQMPAPQLLGQATADFPQQAPVPNASSIAAPRSAFNPTSSTTLGFFIPQDSYFGNSFIPVLPRLEPLPTAPLNHNVTK
ncbi:SOSS complex subunit C homolog [Scaptodrosophila lebanonensis]|uniref:SOSS complex subunit C homolog n=1 Tax=Drosophila lebanonensis TaxID=7225 RepID=A0A6J2UIT0_DROLE|nr:SOSS complex subunit C homolog [Scaptodrosophila lebanonensis]